MYSSIFTHFREPIAIAYSPTESNRPVVFGGSETNTEQQRIEHVTNGNRGQPIGDFMAPFFPSINLENTQKTHNGWSVVPPVAIQSRSDVEKSDKISALLVNKKPNETNGETVSKDSSTESAEIEAIETVTKKFDINTFRPDLQGGFRPIYRTPEAIAEQKNDAVQAYVYHSPKPNEVKTVENVDKEQKNVATEKTVTTTKSDDDDYEYDDDDEEEEEK